MLESFKINRTHMRANTAELESVKGVEFGVRETFEECEECEALEVERFQVFDRLRPCRLKASLTTPGARKAWFFQCFGGSQFESSKKHGFEKFESVTAV